MFPNRLFPGGGPRARDFCSSSLLITPGHQPSLAIPQSILTAHYDPKATTSIPFDASLYPYNPLLSIDEKNFPPDLPHVAATLDIAFHLTKHSVPLDVQKRSLDLALAAHHTRIRRERVHSHSRAAGMVPPGAPRWPFLVQFKRTVSSVTTLHRSAAPPPTLPSATASADRQRPPPPPRPVTPPTTGGRVMAGFTPLPELITAANQTPPRHSVADGRKSPEGSFPGGGDADGDDLMDVDDEIVVQLYESQEDEPVHMRFYDVTVPMRRLTGEDEDY